MPIKYKGKRLKVIKARGFRLGVAYIPHWRTSKDTDRPRELMAWFGPYIFTWKINKRGWVPRHWASLSRMRELEQAAADFREDANHIRHWRIQHGEDV